MKSSSNNTLCARLWRNLNAIHQRFEGTFIDLKVSHPFMERLWQREGATVETLVK